MTIEQQLETIANEDNSQPSDIKLTCVAVAVKMLMNETLTQDDQRDYGAFKNIVDGYIAQVN